MIKDENSTIAVLKREIESLRQEFNVLVGPDPSRVAPFLADLDREVFLKVLREAAEAGNGGLFTGVRTFWMKLQATEKGRRQVLEDELHFWQAVAAQQADLSYKGWLDFKEAAYPVRVQDTIVYVVRSGKWRDREFTEPELRELVELTGGTPAQVAAWVRDVPVLSPLLRERLLDVCAKFRDLLQTLIERQLAYANLLRQLRESERVQSLGTLSAGVAHHINNLLSVILGYATHVLNREKLKQEGERALRKVCEAAQSGRRLTEEILAFLGSEVEDAVPCPLHETVENVLSLMESKIGTRIRVEKDLSARSHVVLAEPSVIRQIVFNLLSNAIESMPTGGTLTVRTYNRPGSSRAKGERVVLEVTDTAGVPVDLAAGEKGTADRVGLRWGSVHGMVGRLEGSVVVSTDPGQATRVEVDLPTVTAEMETQRPPRVRRRLAPSTIWVVDDDPIFREMCRQVLSDEGHKVEEIKGGREFIELWKSSSHRPDVIIMDFSMPEYNGYELCQWLRNEGAYVPIILVSGFAANQPDIRKALKLRRTYFLQKPFSFREMTDIVTVALGDTLIGE